MTPDRLSPRRPATTINLMVTRRCNMACGHCNVESHPRIAVEPAEATLLAHVRAAAKGGVKAINLTGGEPMLRYPVVLRLVRECRRHGLHAIMVSNGFWGRDPRRAARWCRALKRAGLDGLSVSYDRYHAEFQGYGPVLNVARAASATGLATGIILVRAADDAELDAIQKPLQALPGIRLRLYDVQPVGRARQLGVTGLRDRDQGLCVSCASPTLTDDGRLTACGGSSYFAAPGSPLHVGLLRETPLAELLERHRTDPILDTIRTYGPARLREELSRVPGFEAFSFRPRYFGICDLCHHVTSSAPAVAALRQRLAEPAIAAARLAAWQVLETGRRLGTVNPTRGGRGRVARAFLWAAWTGTWPASAERWLGRVDLDWGGWATYLATCGLARPLLPRLDDPQLERWAPSHFRDHLRSRAIADGLAELVQDEALRRLVSIVRGMTWQAVLLKGTALRLKAERDGPPGRAAGDIDLYVDPDGAPALRRRLLEEGFRGDPDAPSTAPHHLAPLSFQGMSVEIHTRILPAVWGLPETDILSRARSLPSLEPIGVPDAESLLLHAVVHTSQHSFAYGLKTGWDVLTLLRDHPEMDWDRVVRWARALRVPRGFWVPLRVLARELDLPVPEAVLRQAPDDARQHRLEAVASASLFRAAGSAELDPISRHGLALLLHDSAAARVRYVGSLVEWACRRPATGRPSGAPPSTSVLRQAWRHWQRYREVARAAPPWA